MIRLDWIRQAILTQKQVEEIINAYEQSKMMKVTKQQFIKSYKGN